VDPSAKRPDPNIYKKTKRQNSSSKLIPIADTS
jgi:hypothetical protein